MNKINTARIFFVLKKKIPKKVPDIESSFKHYGIEVEVVVDKLDNLTCAFKIVFVP